MNSFIVVVAAALIVAALMSLPRGRTDHIWRSR